MNIYTVYAKESDPEPMENMILIKEGFSWSATILHFFWAFYNKMWMVGFIIFAINAFLSILEIKGYFSLSIIQPLRIGLLLFIGCNFNDWHRIHLKSKGYSFCGVISGKNEDEASYNCITLSICNTR